MPITGLECCLALDGRADSVDGRFAAIFYGRAAMMSHTCDRSPISRRERPEMPWKSSSSVRCERGAKRELLAPLAVRAGALPVEIARLPLRLSGSTVISTMVDSHDSELAASSLRLLSHSIDKFDAAMRIHMIAVAVTQALFEQLTRLARTAGDPGLVAQLAAGYGDYEEARMVAELWNVSRGGLSVDAFIARYGFHGPEEGEVSSTSWREDPSLVTSIAERYADHGVEDRAAEQAARRARRVSAEQSLLANLPTPQQIKARAVLRLAERYLPLRKSARPRS